MTYDVREIANLVLDVAETDGRSLTNLDINKIVYFLHGWYMAKTGAPLVRAKIEAWTYGPVFRELYSQFAKFKDKPIRTRAVKRDPDTLENQVCLPNVGHQDREFLMDLARKYSAMRTYDLVELSHAPGGPWHQVYHHKTAINPGMEITDKSIALYFSKQVRH